MQKNPDTGSEINAGVEAPVRKRRSRKRFEKKREAIVDAATILISSNGVKGATLQAVAQAVDLNTTSVTYYFRRKELLAAAVFERAMERIQDIAEEAGAMPTSRERVHRFLELHIELRAAVIRGEALPLTALSDMRTLEDPIRKPLERTYQLIFRIVRDFFGPVGEHKDLMTARAHILLETVFWLPIWISRYPLDEFKRITRRLFDIIENGIGRPDAVWAPQTLPIDADGEGPDEQGASSGASFLRVATRLINETGYRGASVFKIVDELDVTKGSFYHHLDAKDDLVLECFRRSYRRVANVQLAAYAAGANEWERITAAIAWLLNRQFEAEQPLTRTTALQSLPAPVREEVVARSDRTALRFTGSLLEGAAEGSLRLVDPMLASQTIIAMLNAAYDLRKWASQMPRERAVYLYASVFAKGIFADPESI